MRIDNLVTLKLYTNEKISYRAIPMMKHEPTNSNQL